MILFTSNNYSHCMSRINELCKLHFIIMIIFNKCKSNLFIFYVSYIYLHNMSYKLYLLIFRGMQVIFIEILYNLCYIKCLISYKFL